MVYPHCSAIAAAIPGKVLLRSFADLFPFFVHTPGLAAPPCDVVSTHLPAGTIRSVAKSGGRCFSQRHVALRYSWPNIYGWMIWLYGGSPKIFSGIGFSTAILGISAFKHFKKNSAASIPFLYRSIWISPLIRSRFPPALLRNVHGGWAISKSHRPTSCTCPSIVVTCPPSMAFRASPKMCHSGFPPDGS